MIRSVYFLLLGALFLCACRPAPTPARGEFVQADHMEPAFFEKQVLMEGLTDPMEIAIAGDGRVLVVERGGAIHLWDPESHERTMIGYIPVYKIIEDGLLGLALDPDFLDNGWLYTFYAPSTGQASRLSRFTVVDDRLDPASEKILLEVPMQRALCCHAGGSLAFGPDRTLYLAVGDNTDHVDLDGGPIDERPGRAFADAQHTAANTNDLRGKILRIKPEPDGTYSIPEGNLFEGDALHRPEIFAMGLRNPFRIAVDSETGWLYFGDVGNGDPPNERGNWGWDEFNQARGPGNFGWPYITGNNQPYRDYDYESGAIGSFFDTVNLINDSPHNTGARQLPPAQPAFIWYTFGPSHEFPELGAGGVNPMAGPVYRRASNHGPGALPDAFIGKHFIYDWMRNWIKVVSLDEQGAFAGIEDFLPEMTFNRPIDMEVGPDGMLYIAEWGKGFWGSNRDARIVRIRYHGTHDFEPSSYIKKPDSSAMPIRLTAPLDGSFFHVGIPFSFQVETDHTIDARSVKVRTLTGFDTNTFLLDERRNLSGETIITDAYTHVPALHFTDRFALVEACFDVEGLERCDQHKLHPFTKQAEHITMATDAVRHTYGIQPAAADYAETALSVMRLHPGAELRYEPMNVKGMTSITLRYKPFARGQLVVRADTTELGRFDLYTSAHTAVPELQQATVLDGLQAKGQGHVIERLSRSAYQGWREKTIRIPDLFTSRRLVIAAEGEAEDYLVELDMFWVDENR